MVVGDDDQTIYEWRGARPNYILREFRTVFSNKPHNDYTLSRSFRFGPIIAQAAYNVITHNTTRVSKPLVAHSPGRAAGIHVFEGSNPRAVNRDLTDHIFLLVMRHNVPPSQIRVLARTYAQLSGLEAEFLDRRVLYRVVGREPFFERRENRVLLDYVRLAMALDQPVTKQEECWLLSIANTPSRKLGRKDLAQVMRSARYHQASTRQALTELVDNPRSPLYASQQQRVVELIAVLDRIRHRVTAEPGLRAGDLLRWLVDSLDYLQHFTEYYGDGYESFDRQRAVLNFINYAAGTGLDPMLFIKRIEELDTTRGAPEDQQIVMTTVFREKGCEYQYIIIPDCLEGYMPCLRETGNLVFDKAGLVEEPEPSEAIENERRLFYVALTRARRAVYIGTSALSTRAKDASQLPSRFLDEVQLSPTIAIMGCLQRLAAGDPMGKHRLLTAVTNYGGVRKIVRNLVSEYLKDIGDRALTGEVSNVATVQPEKPFAYRCAYEPPKITPTRARPKAPALHQAWDDVARLPF